MKKIIISTIILSTCLGFVGCSNTVGLNNSYESSTTTSLNNSSENTNRNTINTNNIPDSTNQNLPGSTNQNLPGSTNQNLPAQNTISSDEAKQIALQHANLSDNQVTFIKVSQDYDDGINKYEIEFYYNNTEYDYEINAYSGEILKFDYDAEYYNPSNNIPYSTNQNLPTQNTISSDEAKQIALQHANLSDNQVTFIKVSQDYDDGINKYEIEFYYNNTEYDYEINAYSGEILKFDYDAEYYNPSNTISYSNSQSSSTQNLISSDEAKNIALQHANLTDNQVTFIKVSQDYDDGIHIYEVEFHYNNREYNYDINAINGTILSYEQD